MCGWRLYVHVMHLSYVGVLMVNVLRIVTATRCHVVHLTNLLMLCNEYDMKSKQGALHAIILHQLQNVSRQRSGNTCNACIAQAREPDSLVRDSQEIVQAKIYL